MTWLHRYDDRARPAPGEAARAIGMRAVLPMLGLLAANLAVGFAIVGAGGWTFEDSFNRTLQAARTPLLDAIALGSSAIGSAPGNIGLCLVFMGLVWRRTRRWWVAVLPGLALSLEAIVHALTSTLVNRARPAVEHLDAAQPTASFPSGHVGASTAQILVLLLLCAGLRSVGARVALAVVGLGFVAVLGWARLYTGMHHTSDVVVGLINGVACAALAWNYLPAVTPAPAHRRP